MSFNAAFRFFQRVACLGLVMTSALASALDNGSMTSVSPTSPNILYEGRYSVGANGAARLAFPGVTAHLRFRGASLAMQVSASDDIYCDISIDGTVPTLLALKNGEGRYPLFQGETIAEHTVAIIRRNEEDCVEIAAPALLILPARAPPLS